MPRTATATRGASSSAVNATKFGAGQQVLFQGPNWVGLPANNQYGFDILQISGDHYESIIASQNCDVLMQVFGWYLQQTGTLGKTSPNTSGTGSTGTMNASTGGLSPQARGGQTRRARAQSKITSANGAAPL